MTRWKYDKDRFGAEIREIRRMNGHEEHPMPGGVYRREEFIEFVEIDKKRLITAPLRLEIKKEVKKDMDEKITFLLVYRCRQCGEKFPRSYTIGKKHTMAQVIYDLVNGTDAPLIFPEPEMIEPHFCKDGSVGVADFCGFVPRENEQK